jgi:hypothetical protein
MSQDNQPSDRALICCFCGKSWCYDGESPKEPLLKEAYEHEAICEKNPYLLRIQKLEDDLEIERSRLAACGVVALADTDDSKVKAREMLTIYRSASLSDVERRVDECIELRKQRDTLADALAEVRAWGYRSTKERLRCFINKALAATKGGDA